MSKMNVRFDAHFNIFEVETEGYDAQDAADACERLYDAYSFNQSSRAWKTLIPHTCTGNDESWQRDMMADMGLLGEEGPQVVNLFEDDDDVAKADAAYDDWQQALREVRENLTKVEEAPAPPSNLLDVRKQPTYTVHFQTPFGNRTVNYQAVGVPESELFDDVEERLVDEP